MELFFADDSGKDATRANYLIEAAVAFNEAFLPDLEKYIAALKTKFGIPKRYELHWANSTYKHQVGKRSVTGCRLTKEQHRDLRREFFNFLGRSDATIIVAAIEHRRRMDLSRAVAQALEYIAERSQMHLQELYYRDNRNVLGLLIADEPGSSKENRSLMERLLRLHSTGTYFISKFDNLASSLLYPSHFVPGIQLADFVAGAFDRFLNHGDVEWWGILEPYVRRKRGTKGKILGYGIVIRPQVSPLTVGSVEIN